MCVCVGGGGGGKQNRSLSGGAGIYKSVSGDIINACSVVLNPGGGGGGGGGLFICFIPIFIHFVLYFNSV